MLYINLNGNILPAAQAHVSIASPAFKWGDGVFETMRMNKGQVRLKTFHFERLYNSLQLLKIQSGWSPDQLLQYITELSIKNNCADAGRIRLAVFRTDNENSGFGIEALPMNSRDIGWNENGWEIGIFPDARKSNDVFANLKSANYLPYVMAGLFAKEKNWDECLVLNTDRNICDGSKTNVFIVTADSVLTPALNQGCVNGVMRRYIIHIMHEIGMPFRECIIDETILANAREIFLTNAIKGICPVAKFGNRKYEKKVTGQIFNAAFTERYQNFP